MVTAHEATPVKKPHRIKRIVETALVLLPVVWILSAVMTGSFGLEPLGYLILAILTVTAIWVWTQHWSAYLAVLALGIACFVLADGYLILAFWIIGTLYVAIALINLIFIAVRRWRH